VPLTDRCSATAILSHQCRNRVSRSGSERCGHVRENPDRVGSPTGQDPRDVLGTVGAPSHWPRRMTRNYRSGAPWLGTSCQIHSASDFPPWGTHEFPTSEVMPVSGGAFLQAQNPVGHVRHPFRYWRPPDSGPHSHTLCPYNNTYSQTR